MTFALCVWIRPCLHTNKVMFVQEWPAFFRDGDVGTAAHHLCYCFWIGSASNCGSCGNSSLHPLLHLPLPSCWIHLPSHTCGHGELSHSNWGIMSPSILMSINAEVLQKVGHSLKLYFISLKSQTQRLTVKFYRITRPMSIGTWTVRTKCCGFSESM